MRNWGTGLSCAALRFYCGVLRSITPAVCRRAPNRSACAAFRSYSAWVGIAFRAFSHAVRLSNFAGSLWDCAFPLAIPTEYDGTRGNGWGNSECGMRNSEFGAHGLPPLKGEVSPQATEGLFPALAFLSPRLASDHACCLPQSAKQIGLRYLAFLFRVGRNRH